MKVLLKKRLALLLTLAMVLSSMGTFAAAEPAETAAEQAEEPVAETVSGEGYQLAEDSETATGGTCGDDVTWTYEDGVLTISGTGDMEDDTYSNSIPWISLRDSITTVVIESGVTGIGAHAFYSCTNLTSVTIPNSVTTIGNQAFYRCTSLTGVTIPDSVTDIGDFVFVACTGLTSITIPDSVTSIGVSASSSCTGLTSVTLPAGITSITASMFGGCTGLTHITIPDSVTSIGGYAFSGCTGLTSVTIPASVVTIGEYAFYGCTGLTSVTISNGVRWIRDSAFAYCTGLTSVALPASFSTIDEYAFYGCTGLKEFTVDSENTAFCAVDGVLYSKNQATLVVYPAGKTDSSYTVGSSVTAIAYGAFASASQLVSVSMPSDVTSIDSSAFAYCTGLTDVTVPSNMASIGIKAFINTGLTDVYYGGDETDWSAISISSGNTDLTDATIHYNSAVPEGTHTHQYIRVVREDPTCTESGFGTYTCFCGYSYTETYRARGHTAGAAVQENVVEATATEDGSYDSVVYCAICGEEISRKSVTVPATGDTGSEDHTHNWNSGESIAASCTSYSSTIYTCTDCGETKAEYKYDHAVSVAAASNNCTRADFVTMLWLLSGCPKTKTENPFTDVSEDDYYYTAVLWAYENAITAGTSATAFSPNSGITRAMAIVLLRAYVINYAGGPSTDGSENPFTDVTDSSYYYSAVLWAYENGITKGTSTTTFAPNQTMTRAEFITFLYRLMGSPAVETTENPFLDISGADDVETDENNDVSYTAMLWAYEQGILTPAGHIEGEAVVENEAAATSTTDGSYDSVVYCTICGEEISRESVTVPATGDTEEPDTGDTETGDTTHTHSYTTEVTTAATCGADGVMTYTCAECGASYTEAIPATGEHTAGETVRENVVEATATENGSYDSVVYCTACGTEISRESVTVPATGSEDHTHSWTGTVTTAATCTTDGVMTYTCAECGASYTETISATGHTWDEGTVTLAATRVSEGEKTYTCTACGETKTEVIPALSAATFLFSDVTNEESWYYSAVYWAYDLKITEGYSDGTFLPNKNCSRAEFATFLYALASAYGLENAGDTASTSFTDVKSDAWYYTYVMWAAENGLVSGYSDGTFRPNNQITRAEAVTMLYGFYKSFVNGGQEPTVSAGESGFSDLSDSAWYYKYMMWATQNGVVSGYDDGTCRPNTNCTRSVMVVLLYATADHLL